MLVTQQQVLLMELYRNLNQARGATHLPGITLKTVVWQMGQTNPKPASLGGAAEGCKIWHTMCQQSAASATSIVPKGSWTETVGVEMGVLHKWICSPARSILETSTLAECGGVPVQVSASMIGMLVPCSCLRQPGLCIAC